MAGEGARIASPPGPQRWSLPPIGPSRRRRYVTAAILLIACLILLIIQAVGGRSHHGAAKPTGPTPEPPTRVTAVQALPASDMAVSWRVPGSGPTPNHVTATLYAVAGPKGTSLGAQGSITCGIECTSITFRLLTPGVTYRAAVSLDNVDGDGRSLSSNQVTVVDTCPGRVCVTLNATTELGPAERAASGILISTGSSSAATDLTQLGTTAYRGSPTCCLGVGLNWTAWDEAAASGAQTTLILSDVWSEIYHGDPPTPWSNWTAYSSWVKGFVAATEASGRHPNFWEVYNEPNSRHGYYQPAKQATVTTSRLLQQFLVAYDAIEAADSSAQIIGPSLSHFEDWPGQYDDTGPDLTTFLNFAVAHRLHLAAISWHEIDDSLGPNPDENTVSPLDVADHISEARQLIAARPSLGPVQVFVNEYGIPEVSEIPGWDVAYLSGFSSAEVNSAGRACWFGECGSPSLDGLITASGQTLPDFFVRQVYADMTGRMVATQTSNDEVTALGSWNPSTSTFLGLVGRGVGCGQSAYCPSSFPATNGAGPVTVTVKVVLPIRAGTVQVDINDIPGQQPDQPLSAPTPVMVHTLPLIPAGSGRGQITVTIPRFSDGDAYSIYVSKL